MHDQKRFLITAGPRNTTGILTRTDTTTGKRVFIMHDQKLTEGEGYQGWWKAEWERVRDELDYFTRYYLSVRRGVEDNTKDTNLILGQRGRSNWTTKIPNLFQRNKQADQLLKRGMVGAATRMVMEGVFGKNYVPPTIMRPEFTGYEFMHKKPVETPDVTTGLPMLKKHVKEFAEAHMRAIILGEYWEQFRDKPIDHPYLLPPATYTISNLAKNGERWWVRNRSSVLCGKDGFPLHDDYQTVNADHFRMNSDLVIRAIKGHFDR